MNLSPLRRVPMLAETFAKHSRNIKYPAYVQPKLDGCRAIFANGTISSRTGLPISDAKRIISELREANNSENLVLDGELYCHGYSFQNVMKLVHADSPELEYHVYDIIPSQSSSMTFAERNKKLREFFDRNGKAFTRVKYVETFKVSSEKEVEEMKTRFEKEGFEGAMVRNASSLYLHGRSRDLQKVKSFKDDEFKVVGAEESKTGGVIWNCETENKKIFKVKPKGSDAEARIAYKNYHSKVGKFYTVQYQELTDAGIPRFPIGLGFKDEKDLDRQTKTSPQRKQQQRKQQHKAQAKVRSHTGRPSPSEHARDYKNQKKIGNDGLLYESRADVRGVYTWKKVKE